MYGDDVMGDVAAAEGDENTFPSAHRARSKRSKLSRKGRDQDVAARADRHGADAEDSESDDGEWVPDLDVPASPRVPRSHKAKKAAPRPTSKTKKAGTSKAAVATGGARVCAESIDAAATELRAAINVKLAEAAGPRVPPAVLHGRSAADAAEALVPAFADAAAHLRHRSATHAALFATKVAAVGEGLVGMALSGLLPRASPYAEDLTRRAIALQVVTAKSEARAKRCGDLVLPTTASLVANVARLQAARESVHRADAAIDLSAHLAAAIRARRVDSAKAIQDRVVALLVHRKGGKGGDGAAAGEGEDGAA